MQSLEIVQWNSTKRDHPGNPGGVSGSGPVINIQRGINMEVNTTRHKDLLRRLPEETELEPYQQATLSTSQD